MVHPSNVAVNAWMREQVCGMREESMSTCIEMVVALTFVIEAMSPMFAMNEVLQVPSRFRQQTRP